ncbi:glycosyl hydrolase [Sulfurimonas sp. HSL-1716]|uniref:glycosyl hydrolase n=1 Tax=Hydrocurvibacter sulfurireducens TaxID=3131937 RepID=UPI0031F854E2
MKKPFVWDDFSDQPFQLKDKNFKKMMRKRELFSIIKTSLTALVVLPISVLMMPFVKRKTVDAQNFFAMSVNLDKEPSLTQEFLEDLGVEHILVRCKLWEMEKLRELNDFILACNAKEVTVNILQDREHIDDPKLLEDDLRKIFTGLQAQRFQIGSTINRAKWGFFSVDEYNRFFETAYKLKQKEFPNIELIGSGVIDFEYHFTAHTLFNFFDYRYDGIASLLYVDRRGAPENTQMGFSLLDKIAWLSTLIWLSPKSKNRLYITETNWPISNTAPYAPTSEYECVDEESYANYLIRYYLLAFASQQVDAVCWHQLIAPGYGLIDNRQGVRKRSAFYAFKTLLFFLKSSQFLRLDIKRGYHILQCLKDEKLIQIHWSLEKRALKNEDYFIAYSRDGEVITDDEIIIFDKPVYLQIKD